MSDQEMPWLSDILPSADRLRLDLQNLAARNEGLTNELVQKLIEALGITPQTVSHTQIEWDTASGPLTSMGRRKAARDVMTGISSGNYRRGRYTPVEKITYEYTSYPVVAIEINSVSFFSRAALNMIYVLESVCKTLQPIKIIVFVQGLGGTKATEYSKLPEDMPAEIRRLIIEANDTHRNDIGVISQRAQQLDIVPGGVAQYSEVPIVWIKPKSDSDLRNGPSRLFAKEGVYVDVDGTGVGLQKKEVQGGQGGKATFTMLMWSPFE